MRVGLALFLLAAALAGCHRPAPPEPAPTQVAVALGGPAEGYARALGPRSFQFPADHGAHPEYRNEWWYVTGNLEDDAGRRFGFQFTLFRIALTPEPRPGPSAWATNQVWMGHFALTDAAGGEHHAFERFARGAAGLAGAELEPSLRIWLEDWSLSGGAAAGFPWRLQAAAGTVGLDLQLVPRKAVVLQGEAGLSQKSAEPGNASYYYSLPRLEARGEVVVGGEARSVSGLAWLDREWSTSALGAGQVGWDWFSLQFEDGADLMYYQLRRADGSADAHSAGSLSAADGSKRRLGPGEVRLEVLERWTSPRGVTYPSAWRLEVAGVDAPLIVRPVLADQEMDLTVRYWEGAVDVLDQTGRPLGRGYVELAGY